jgi:DNA-directed RNA polymerase specialized sigma24 family protein
MAAKRSKSKTLPATADIDFKKLFKLRYYNQLSLGQISDLTGVSKSTLQYWFSPVDKFIKNPKELEIYKNNKEEFLQSLEYELLTDLLDTDKRKKASLNNVAYAFQQIHVARRLEQGLSTGNLAVNVEKSLTTAHEKAQKMRDKLSKSAAID